MLSKFASDEMGGCNPFYLPPQAAGGSGYSQPPFKVGEVVRGDAEAEFVLCALALAATTNLTPGLAFGYDKDFNATLLTTASAVQGQSVGVGLVYAPATVAGSYFIWLQRAGHAPVAATSASVFAALAETTTTPGVLNFTNTPTAGTRKVTPLALFASNVQFTANTTTGSNLLSAVSSITDLAPGATLAGAGIPANTTLVPYAQPGAGGANNGNPIRALNGVVQMSANATAAAQAITVTVTGVLNGNLMRPTIGTGN